RVYQAPTRRLRIQYLHATFLSRPRCCAEIASSLDLLTPAQEGPTKVARAHRGAPRSGSRGLYLSIRSTGGGVSADRSRWIASRPDNYLVPVEVLSALFRGRVLGTPIDDCPHALHNEIQRFIPTRATPVVREAIIMNLG